MKLILSFFVLLFVVVNCQTGSEWNIIQNNYATIAIGLDFQTETSGWIAGSDASSQGLLLHTTDSGVNLTNANQDYGAAIFMSVAMNSDGSAGLAAGFGSSIFNIPCESVTNNSGKNWNATNNDGLFFCISQSVDVVDKTFISAGAFNGVEGVRVSNDEGASWNTYDAGIKSVRYVSFVDSSTGYLTAGSWPVDDEQEVFSEKFRGFSQFLVRNKYSKTGLSLRTQQFKKKMINDDDENPLANYTASISQTLDGGKTWEIVFQDDNQGYYFNQISCVKSGDCIAVGEGVDSNGYQIGYIFVTKDNFKTIKKTTIPNASVMAVDRLNEDFAIVGTTVPGPLNSPTGEFYWTDDSGNTWAKYDSSLTNFAPTDVSVVSSDVAYSAGITQFGLSSLGSLQPSN